LVVMGSDMLLDGGSFDFLGRIDGIVLLAFFGIFLYYTWSISKATGETGEQIEVLPTWKSIGLVLIGLIGLTLGGKLIVDAAVTIASGLGVSEHLIGLTIVALGTSLPELATAIVAAIKRQTDMVIGNVVGSNIFNIFFVLGTTATVSPIAFSSVSLQDAFALMVVSTILFLAMFVGKKQSLDKWQGAAFVGMYVLYIGMSVIRG
jgi:cation:H+ antiporter